MEAAHFETKLIRSVLIEVVILSKLESTYFTSDTSTTGSGQKIKKSIMKMHVIVVAYLISNIVPNQLLFWGILLVINFFSPKVLILGKTVWCIYPIIALFSDFSALWKSPPLWEEKLSLNRDATNGLFRLEPRL